MQTSAPQIRRTAAWLCLPLLAVALSGCASAPPESTAMNAQTTPVDLPRFMGTWHVIANIPYFAENGKVATRDEYRLRPDGRIDNDFVFKKAFGEEDRRWTGVSTVVPGTQGREWKVQFIWPISTRLQVLEVSPDYRTALLATPNRKMAWVFARDAVLSDADYAVLKTRIGELGVDASQLQRVTQVAEQMGQPGFQ
jgi:apolipoprotein D and lipocalin family protein